MQGVLGLRKSDDPDNQHLNKDIRSYIEDIKDMLEV